MTSGTDDAHGFSEKAYLKFYGALGIIPVRQDLSNLSRHFQRRAALYDQLGLLPNAVRGRKLLEVGPGTGDNALYTAALKPERYVLLDANPASLNALRSKIASGGLPSGMVDIVDADFATWQTEERFDVVLCEGTLPAQNNPEQFLNRLLDLTAPGGVAVITTVSHTSLFAETCRRVLRLFFTTPDRPLAEAVRDLTAFFEPDLRSLPGMSRMHQDWVLDQIIHPYGMAVAFSLRDAIVTAADRAVVAGTSPRFLTDWRWYKQVPEGSAHADFVLEQVDRFSLAMIDYRMSPLATDPALGRAVEDRCRALWRLHLELLESGNPAAAAGFADAASAIGAMLPEGFDGVRRAIDDFTGALGRWAAGDRAADFGSFRPLFGRGQQYLMLMRPLI